MAAVVVVLAVELADEGEEEEEEEEKEAELAVLFLLLLAVELLSLFSVTAPWRTLAMLMVSMFMFKLLSSTRSTSFKRWLMEDNDW